MKFRLEKKSFYKRYGRIATVWFNRDLHDSPIAEYIDRQFGHPVYIFLENGHSQVNECHAAYVRYNKKGLFYDRPVPPVTISRRQMHEIMIKVEEMMKAFE